MNVDSLSIRLVIDPVSFVNIAIYVRELAKAMSSVIFPVALVACSIRPNLLSIAIAEATDPLTSVLRASRICICLSLLALCIRIVKVCTDGLFQLDLGKVATICSFCLLKKGNVHSGGVSAP